MFDDFYLWCNMVLDISPTVMRYIIEKHINSLKERIKEISHIKDISLEDIYGILLDDIIYDTELKEKIRNKFQDNKYYNNAIMNIKYEMRKRNIEFITVDSDLYSNNLREIYDYPYILYYRGNISLLNSDSSKIAVVGSRKATDYGYNVTRFLVKELSNSDFIIVSGMASGIDSYAHKSCIDSGAKTIAVLGTPIDQIYPNTNRKLYSEILNSGGLIISEYNFSAKVYPSNFAIRNRIVSGISDSVLVTEAKKKSGAIITVDCALQQGKTVYSVPGSIFSSMSEGCNDIIAEGAKVVRNIEDILEDFKNICFENSSTNSKFKNIFYKNSRKNMYNCDNINLDDNKDIEISNEEIHIFNILSEKGAVNLDDICRLTKYSIKDVNYYIGNLMLMDLVVEQGFNLYAPNIIKK